MSIAIAIITMAAIADPKTTTIDSDNLTHLSVALVDKAHSGTAMDYAVYSQHPEPFGPEQGMRIGDVGMAHVSKCFHGPFS